MSRMSGKHGKIQLGTVLFDVTGWEANSEVDLVSVNDTQDEGCDSDVVAFGRLTGSAKFKFDPAKYPTVPIPTVGLGKRIALNLYTDQTDVASPDLDVPVAVVTKLGTALEVEGSIEGTLEFKAQGKWKSWDGEDIDLSDS